MNRLLLRAGMVAAMLMMIAGSAFAVPAPGLNMAWGNCATQGGTQNQIFACDADDSAFQLVGSFVLAQADAGVTGVEVIVDLITATSPLPAWWDLGTGGCRDGNLSCGDNAPLSNTLCKDWAINTSAGGLAAYGPDGVAPNGSISPADAPAHRRLLAGFAVATAKNLVVAKEYYTFNIIILTAGTVAAPVCAGCATPACIVLNSINVVSGTASNDFIGTASAAGSNFATWQGGSGANCAAVPVKNATWGQVKALYR
jgi:hypothetical protein